MELMIERYRQIAVAVLESLRATVYPSYRLQPLKQTTGFERAGIGWILGVPAEAGARDGEFEPYLGVELVLDEDGNPTHFACWNQEGHKVQTPDGDLSKAALVDALERLHQTGADSTHLIWRWLGRQVSE